VAEPLSPAAQALLYAGEMADCAMSLVGGQGLNGLTAAAHPDDFSDCIKRLRIAVEKYNQHILSMNNND
jgi:hypothetical protein